MQFIEKPVRRFIKPVIRQLYSAVIVDSTTLTENVAVSGVAISYTMTSRWNNTRKEVANDGNSQQRCSKSKVRDVAKIFGTNFI